MATDPIALAKATQQYGLPVQQAARRSQYLTAALQQISDGSKITGGYGEVAAKLLATAILSRASNKAQDATSAALKSEKDAKIARLLAGLPGATPEAPVVPQGPPPGMQTAPPPQPVEQRPLPPLQPQANAAPQIDPNVDAIVRTVWGEARGEDPTGQAAVAGVILNRAKERGMGPRDVVLQRGQFEPWGNPDTRARMESLTPDSPEYQAILNNIAPALNGQNPVGGADHFYSPGAQSALGRPPPKWDNGRGQDLGRHRFFDLEQGKPDVQMTAAPGPAPQMQVQQQFPQGGAQPFQIASNELQPGMIPSANASPAASSPPPAGAPAPGPSPQAPPGAGMPATYQPTPQEISLVRQLLTSQDPAEQAYGEKMAFDLREKMTQPVKYDTTTVNGLPMQVDPYTGRARPVDIPQDARTRVISAQEAGIPAPPGTMVSIDPMGNIKEVARPPAGQQVVSAPGQQYREAPVQGSGNDPLSPTNLITGEGKLRDDYEKQIQPYIIARQGYQKVVEAAKTGNPAGDIALVFGYMKTLDPGSTVREGEQAQVANSGTIPQTVTNIYNKLITGQGALSPAQRAQFADSARKQFGVYQSTADDLNKRFGQLSQSYGYNPERIVRQFEPVAPFEMPADARAPIPEPARQAYQRRFQSGQIDTQAPVGSAKNPYQARDEQTLRALDNPNNRGKYVIGPDGSFGVID